MNPVINVDLKNDKQSLKSPIPIYSEKVQTPLDFAVNKLSAEPNVNCGLLNKRNTCYINVSLQCLSTKEQLRLNFTFCNNSLSPFTSFFVRIMFEIFQSSVVMRNPHHVMKNSHHSCS